MKRVIFAAVLAWLTAVSGAYAQTGVVTNPRELEFESPDHEKFAADGTTPLVLRYDVCWRFVGAATCFTTTDLGKPAAVGVQNGNPLIRTNIQAIVRPLPTTNVFEAIGKAIGPGGESDWSQPSNSFQQAAVPSTPLRATVR